jgi:hypothetical protein
VKKTNTKQQQQTKQQTTTKQTKQQKNKKKTNLQQKATHPTWNSSPMQFVLTTSYSCCCSMPILTCRGQRSTVNGQRSTVDDVVQLLLRHADQAALTDKGFRV